MARVFFITLLFIVLGGALGYAMSQNLGTIVIHFGDSIYEMTVWGGLFLLLGVTVVIVISYKVINRLRHVLFSSENFYHQYKIKRHRKKLHQGLILFFSDNWKAAQKNLLASHKNNEYALLQQILAAHSAHKMGQDEDAKALLFDAEALAKTADEQVLVVLNQAKLQLAQKHYDIAIAILNKARSQYPHNAAILNMLKHIYLDVGDWAGLNELSGELKQYKLMPSQDLQELDNKIDYENFIATGRSEEIKLEQLERIWQKLPKHNKETPSFIGAYCQLLLLKKAYDQAETLLRVALTKHWHDPFVVLYSTIPASDTNEQYQHAKRWLKHHEQNPQLHLCLGRLCLKLNLWEKAKEHFNSSINLTPNFDAYIDLAKVHALLGDHKSSVDTYQKALQQEADKNNEYLLGNQFSSKLLAAQ